MQASPLLELEELVVEVLVEEPVKLQVTDPGYIDIFVWQVGPKIPEQNTVPTFPPLHTGVYPDGQIGVGPPLQIGSAE